MTVPQYTPTLDATQEEWRAVVGYEGIYEVSSQGRVQRILAGGRTWHVPHIMIPCVTNRKYASVTLCRNAKNQTMLIHRLVAAAFIGPCPKDHQVDHLDGNRFNNCAANLEYVTNRENSRRSIQNGQCGYVKLNQEAANVIRASTEKSSELAERFGVSVANISLIRSGYGWNGSKKRVR